MRLHASRTTLCATLALLLATATADAADRREELALVQPEVIAWHFFDLPVDTPSDFEQWGLPTDRLLAGEPIPDFADGIDELIAFRDNEMTDGGDWYLLNHVNGGSMVLSFGLAGDRPAVGDFTGDGLDNAAVAQLDQFFIVDSNRNLIFDDGIDQRFDWAVSFAPDDRLIPCQFGGPGGYEDLAVWRDASATWEIYVVDAAGPAASPLVISFGSPGDLPAAGILGPDTRCELITFRPGDDILRIDASENGYSGSADFSKFLIADGFDHAAVMLQHN